MDFVSEAKRLGVAVKRDVEGRLLTSFGSGGRVKYLLCPSSVRETAAVLKLLISYGVPYRVIGGGSNLLLPDEGYAGALVKPHLTGIGVCGGEVTADAGVKMPILSKLAAEKGLSGLEFACGIPGTMGGAAKTNAGAFGQMLSNVLAEVIVLTRQGEVKSLPARHLKAEYHSCVLPKDCVVLCARLALQPDDAGAIKERMRRMKLRRQQTQPGEPSAGSVFRRVGETPAALYVEKTGLKGLRIGGAELSPKHCNFIVNKGGATTSDYFAVAEQVKSRVFDAFGVSLTYEVERICSPKSS